MPVSRQAARKPAVDRRSGTKQKSEAGDDRVVPKRVVVLGVTEKAKLLAEALLASSNPAYEIVGYLAEDASEAGVGMNVLGRPSQMMEIAQKLQIDEVIVASLPSWLERLAEAISLNGNGHPRIRVVPGVYDAMICNPKMTRVKDVPVMTLNYQRPAYSRFCKRLLDIIFSAAALVVSAPLMAVAVGLVKLTSSGPMLYRQSRVGYQGREFMLLKLRTMIHDAERDTGPVLASANDGRVTTVGRALRRLKIDELPQFYNVLRGDMSVVGPRPERRCFVEQYNQSIPGYTARHQVRPGITGPAQVYGGYTTDPEVKLKYDLMYVYGAAMLTDIKILVLTIPAMIHG